VKAEQTGVLDELDGERPDEPFVVQFGGSTAVFRPAVGPGWQELIDALAWPPAFVELFGPEDDEGLAIVDVLSVWQMRGVLRAWLVHHGLCADFASNLRLVGMLTKPAYRAAAERDLWEVHRLDLATEWQARRWRRLLNLLDGLRRTSHVSEAMAEDDELADMYLERERKGEIPDRGPRRRIIEYSTEAELLSVAVDRLGELIQAHATSKGARRRRIEPMPRPVTAINRAKDRRAKRKHKYTVARVYGYIDDKGQPTGRGPVPEGTPPTP
jgi:hypothetical protein